MPTHSLRQKVGILTLRTRPTWKRRSSTPIRRSERRSAQAPSAFWIDSKSKIRLPAEDAPGDPLDTVEGILRDASATHQLVVFILYNLPNRDCNAKASNGEICCVRSEKGGCDYTAVGCGAGLRQYMFSHSQTSSGPTIERFQSSSLSNQIRWASRQPKCTPTTINAYRYCLRSGYHHSRRYIDAGHGGWLGFENNAKLFAQIVAGMGILPKIRALARMSPTSSHLADHGP